MAYAKTLSAAETQREEKALRAEAIREDFLEVERGILVIPHR